MSLYYVRKATPFLSYFGKSHSSLCIARVALLLVTISSSLLFSVPALSATWSGSGGVSVSLGVTRNSVDSSIESQQASSVIFEPFYSFSRVNRNHTLRARLGVRHQRFSDNGGQSTAPSVAASSRVTINERGLWWNTSAGATSKRVTSLGFIDEEAISEDQTTTALQLQFGPELRYSGTDNLLVNGRATVARNQARGVGSNERDSTSLGIESSFLWALNTRGHLLSLNNRVQETRFDTLNGQVRLASLTVGGIVPLTSQLSIFARVGYDWVEFLDQPDSDSVDENEDIRRDANDRQHTLGLNWQPYRFLEFRAEYSERAFGRQPFVSMLLRGRSSQFEFRWSRDWQLAQLVDTELREITVGTAGNDGLSSEQEETDNPPVLVTPQTCDTAQGSGCLVVPFVVNSRTIAESISLIYTLKGRVSSLSMSLTRSQLSTIDEDTGRTNDIVDIRLTRSLSRNLSSTLSVRASEFRSSDNVEQAGGESQSIRVSLTWLSR